MESQPQNPEFRNNPENFHPCICLSIRVFWLVGWFDLLHLSLTAMAMSRWVSLPNHTFSWASLTKRLTSTS